MSDSDNDLLAPKNNDDVLRIARERFKLVEDSESEIRKMALEDLRFVAGRQWPDDIKTAREMEGRPCLVINRLPQFIRQVTNDQRQNRPSIKVYPVGDGAEEETAKVIQGMCKHIEYNSNADVAYDTAFESAARIGRGFFRVITDYCDPMSFNQEILIKMIDNSFTVFFDPLSVEPDGSDANWALVADTMSKSEFKINYPDAQMATLDDWTVQGSNTDGWITKDGLRIAEYYCREFKKRKILLLSNGETILDPGLAKDEDGQLLKESGESADLGLDDNNRPITIKDSRESVVPVIHWYKLTYDEVLEETEWLGQWIPIIPVYGDKLNVDGERIFEGIVTHAKDPQRMYNYHSSNEVEIIALAPKAPWIGVAGQFEGFESFWKSANKKSHAYLEYKPISVAGSPAPPPQRNVFEPPVAAVVQAKAMSADDMKATTGIYDSALGNSPNDTSGIAITKRNTQAQVSNFHFIDNMNRSLRHCGRIIVDLIPGIYDAPRIQRIIKDDGTHDMVPINQIFGEGPDKKHHNLGIGKYDVIVDSGPSFATRRQEAAQSIEKLIGHYPALMQVAGDLMVRNMDWPQSQEVADRLKKTIPPNLLDDGKNQPQIPPQVQAQMQQMNTMVQSLTKSLTVANGIIENKKLELASKERIEMAKLQMGAEETLLKVGNDHAQFSLEQQIALLDKQRATLQAQQPLSNDQISNPNAGPSGSAQQGNNQQQPTGGFPPG